MGCKGRVYAFIGKVESFVEFPAGLVGIGFRCVVKTWLVGVDTGKLTKLLPGPICSRGTEVLYIAVSLGYVEASGTRMPHCNAGR